MVRRGSAGAKVRRGRAAPLQTDDAHHQLSTLQQDPQSLIVTVHAGGAEVGRSRCSDTTPVRADAEWLTCPEWGAAYYFINPSPGATSLTSEIQTLIRAPGAARSDTCSHLARLGPLSAG